MLLATNNTIRRYYTAECKKRKLYRIAMRTYELCIYYSNKCIMPKG